MSNTYHFTPPTCTLEIIGNKSFWLGKKVELLHKFQFKLKFDDPRQPTTNQVTIEGNKQDLEQLQTALEGYLINQLQPSFSSNTTIPSTRIKAYPYFQSKGLTNHELFFGSLSNDSDRQQITLGTVQLFDLVTALEAYQTKISSLTNQPETKPTGKIILFGGGIAAAVIAAIFIPTILKPQLQPEIASNQNNLPPAQIPELNEITPPTMPNRDRDLPNLREPIASSEKLPPPPAVETPKPKPNVPDPADYPITDVGRIAKLNDLTPKKQIREQFPEPIEPHEPQNRADSESIILEQDSPETKISQEQLTAEQRKTNLDLESDLANESLESVPNVAIRNPPNRVQIQEVSAYFRDRWQPPADLKQSLEYRLFLREDGSIKKVVPLGKAARLYLGQTNIPLSGEQFISPSLSSQSSIIRLLLNPDGRVQAFME